MDYCNHVIVMPVKINAVVILTLFPQSCVFVYVCTLLIITIEPFSDHKNAVEGAGHFASAFGKLVDSHLQMSSMYIMYTASYIGEPGFSE